MTKKRYRWNRRYFVTGGIIIFGLIYFFLPFLRKNEVIHPIILVLKEYTVNPILDYVVLPLNQGFNELHQSLLNPLNDEGVKELKNKVINLERQLKVKDHLIERLNYLNKENDELRLLLGFRSNTAFSIIPAEIISYQSQNVFYSFWIGVGKNQSITNRAVVIAFNQKGEQGLVGFIVESLDDKSLVQSVLEPQTHVSVVIEGYRSKAILKNHINLKRVLSIDFINNDFTNLEGKYVYTSGMGKRYPSGVKVGEIIATGSSLYDLFQSATVKPTIDFTSLKHVFVLISQEDK